MVLKRFVEKELETWFRRKWRKPLVVRGARQVGKSTLIRNFAANHQLTLHEINLERHPDLAKSFENLDINELLREFEYISGKGKVNSPGSILFIDEIQAIPVAVKALRYFYEDYPGLPLIAAGSLLEFTLSDHNYSMPVGRIEYLYMGPMTIEEFLLAKNEIPLLELIKNYNLKAGKSGSLKSLHRFTWEKKSKRAVRFDLNPPFLMDSNHKVHYGQEVGEIAFKLLSLPLYMVEQLPRLFKNVFLNPGD